MADIPRSAMVSERRARELFIKEFHYSPMQYLMSVRLKHASYLLRFSDLSISEIAQQVGFEDSNYFSRCFRQNMNMTPSEYRNHDGNSL